MLSLIVLVIYWLAYLCVSKGKVGVSDWRLMHWDDHWSLWQRGQVSMSPWQRWCSYWIIPNWWWSSSSRNTTLDISSGNCFVCHKRIYLSYTFLYRVDCHQSLLCICLNVWWISTSLACALFLGSVMHCVLWGSLVTSGKGD